MFLFGYIVSETKYNGLSNGIIKVVKNESECTLDVPKLIIGLSKAKEYAQSKGFEFDILDHMFPDGNMWTFKKTEKREIYEENIIEFKNYIIKSISKNINYYYINIYNLKYKDIKRLYNILFNNKFNRNINYIFIDKEMMYYCLDNNNVIGISLGLMKYMGIDREKVISKIKSGKNNSIVFSSNKKLWQLKDWFNGMEYIIPSLLTNNTIK